jgi:hypothetical protein
MAILMAENSPEPILVDGADLEVSLKIKWYINKKTGYVYGYFGYNRKRYLHRWLLGITDRKVMVDHEDRNKRNNQRHNLRVCSNAQNSQNSKSRPGTSKYKGVSWEKRVEKWRATIVKDGRQTHIGTFKEAIEAAKAYDAKAKELFGPFAYLNFPESCQHLSVASRAR